jgi:transcription-repair coupling factor (superfamily II helicase)
MRDLDIRGAGNMLGGEQSGFIAEIGFEMYQKILDEAVRELKRNEFREVFKEEIQKQDDYVSDCTIDTDLEILIPDEYVESITERLSLYSRLDNCETEKELEDLHKEMIDRFGPVPPQVEDLFTTVRCRKIAVELGFEKIILKNENLKCFFVGNPESPYFSSKTFEGILHFIQTQTNKAKLKQVGKNGILVVHDISSMKDLYRFLKQMEVNVIMEEVI